MYVKGQQCILGIKRDGPDPVCDWECLVEHGAQGERQGCQGKAHWLGPCFCLSHMQTRRVDGSKLGECRGLLLATRG